MRQNKRTVAALVVFVAFLLIITLAASYRQKVRLAEGEEQIRVLQEAIDDEKVRTEEINAKQQYMQSDEYKEQVAKDKLGLIRDGEIIFKESDTE